MIEEQELKALEAEIFSLEKQAEEVVSAPTPAPQKAKKGKKEKVAEANHDDVKSAKQGEVLYGAAKVKAKFLNR